MSFFKNWFSSGIKDLWKNIRKAGAGLYNGISTFARGSKKAFSYIDAGLDYIQKLPVIGSVALAFRADPIYAAIHQGVDTANTYVDWVDTIGAPIVQGIDKALGTNPTDHPLVARNPYISGPADYHAGEKVKPSFTEAYGLTKTMEPTGMGISPVPTTSKAG